MKGTRWKAVLRDCGSAIHRELRISISPFPHPEKWVFLVGCYNSGTTLLGKILATHTHISALPSEGQYLTDQFPSDHEMGLSRMWVQREDLYRLTEEDEGPDPDRIKREWGMRSDQTKPIILERTPANAARTRWLQKHFENAYFIGIVRNGYAVAEGITRKARPIHSKHGWSIEQAAYQWAHSNHILKEDRKYLKHFMWIKYEDLTGNPKNEIDRIQEFLDIGNKEAINLNKNWSVHERNQKIRNMNEESINRLSNEQIARINDISGPVLRSFDYKKIPASKETPDR